MNRPIKRLILRACSPLDSLVRAINGKQHLPPLHLRWDVGPLRGFESSSAEFRVYLKLFAGLGQGVRILDIGCGCGQIAQVIADDLGTTGSYVGCDINSEAIAWCTRWIARNDGRFAFHRMDVRNGLYNPGGRQAASEFRFPPPWGSFDIILLKSVFTHMRKDEVTNYLGQLRGLMRDGGTCLATFFLTNDAQRSLVGQASVRFVPGEPGVGYAAPDIPETIVAYEERDLLAMISDARLRLEPPIRYGTWAGRVDGLSHQDILLLTT
jgi:SAM-dependent methyltransferase